MKDIIIITSKDDKNIKHITVLYEDGIYNPEVNGFIYAKQYQNLTFNTRKMIANDLKLFYSFLKEKNMTYNDVPNVANPLSFFVDFKKYIWTTKDNVERNKASINEIVGYVLQYLEYLCKNKYIESIPYEKRYVNKNRYTFISEFLPKHRTNGLDLLSVKVDNHKPPIKYIKAEPQMILDKVFTERERELFNSPIDRRLTLSELMKLRNYVILELLFFSGARISEALGIHVCDLSSLERGILYVVSRKDNENGAYQKTGSRTLVVTSTTVSHIFTLVEQTMNYFYPEFLFVNYSKKYGEYGHAYKYNSFYDYLRRIESKLNKEDFYNEYHLTSHKGRHYFVTTVNRKTDIVNAQLLTGHKNINTTIDYLEEDYESQKNLIESIYDEEIN